MRKKSRVIVNSLQIGQTLETKDEFLPHNEATSQILKESRPVIIVGKINNPSGKEEYAVVPTSSKKTGNTTRYNKHGIKNYRHSVEVRDNEGKPISQNEKFVKTERCTKIPKQEADKIKDRVANHTKFSSENRRKLKEFETRYKKARTD